MIFAEIDKDGLRRLPLGLAGLRDSGRQGNVTRHRGFEFHQILWCTAGSGSYEVGGEVMTLTPGEGVYMRPGVPHSYGGEDFHTGFCSFSIAESVTEIMGIGDWFRFRTTPTFLRELDNLLHIAIGDSTLIDRSAAGYYFVTGFFASQSRAEISPAERIKRIIERRYSEPLSLLDIAEEMGMDRYSVCHIYKQHSGVTVMEDLLRIRLQKAKQLLKYDTATVEEVGRLCGFDSPSYFGKLFKKKNGCTPAEYRRRKMY